MRNPYTDQTKYIRDIYKKIDISRIEKPILKKYYEEVNTKVKPSIEKIESVDDYLLSQIRNEIIHMLRPYLHNSADFIEELTNNNELQAFYNYGKLFLSQISTYRNMDNDYISQLWNKFKDKMLIKKENSNNPSYLTASQYEKALQNYKITNPQNIINEINEVINNSPESQSSNKNEIITIDEIDKYILDHINDPDLKKLKNFIIHKNNKVPIGYTIKDKKSLNFVLPQSSVKQKIYDEIQNIKNSESKVSGHGLKRNFKGAGFNDSRHPIYARR